MDRGNYFFRLVITKYLRENENDPSSRSLKILRNKLIQSSSFEITVLQTRINHMGKL
jgi:hypothetical protein